MAQRSMLMKYLRPALDSELINRFTQFRVRRLLQISGFTLCGLALAACIAHGITQILFIAGCVAMLFSAGLALAQRVLAAAYTLLWSLAIMLAAFAYSGSGMLDFSLLGYPGLLVYAAILGSIGLFCSLLGFILLFCTAMTWLTLNGIIVPRPQLLSWHDLMFIFIIFIVTAVSIYLMIKDMRKLMAALQRENARVHKSRLQIERQAHHDLLTDLPNRVLGEQLFQQMLGSNQQQLAVLFLDLDDFKPVNDALGHAAGDQLLQQLAQRLRQVLTVEQKVIRFGGDEFVFLVPLTAGQPTIAELAATLIKQTTSVFTVLQTDVSVSASIGIAMAPADGTEFAQLCRKADLAMYKAKDSGKNTFCFYDDQLDQANVDRFQLLQSMRHALEDHAFALYYQPKVNLQHNSVTSMEALLRWPQPDGSMIGPDVFIPLAESSGLINELGTWVLQQACLCCARLRRQGFTELRVAVNLSYVQFKNARLLQLVQQALREAELPATALELELTESLLIGDSDFIQRQLSAISQLGVTFAIDDFGTGYSNLSYLRSFNATSLKIDRSFISSLEESSADETLVRAIIQMASSLNLTTVAEGIEHEQTAALLRALGCDEGQGYYWSPAVPEHKLPALLTAQAPLL